MIGSYERSQCRSSRQLVFAGGTSDTVAAVATFALIRGGGGSAWDWHLVAPALREHRHDAVAVDLPGEDESAGWEEYAIAVVEAIGDRRGVVVVGHSLGGFTAPLACVRIPVDLLVASPALSPGVSAAALGVAGAYAGAGALLAREGLVRLRDRSRPRRRIRRSTNPGSAERRAKSARKVPGRSTPGLAQVGELSAAHADTAAHGRQRPELPPRRNVSGSAPLSR